MTNATLTKQENTSLTRRQFRQAVDTFIPAFITAHNSGDDIAVPSEITTALSQHEDPNPRDYLLGAVQDYDMNDYITAISKISSTLPADNSKSAKTILSALNYEAGNMELAGAYLSSALTEDKDYSLGKLLLRVFNAGWPTSIFTNMREELHQKVAEDMTDIAI
jgi:Domain of unknown function (DUF4192)